jgi:hypothetical protein
MAAVLITFVASWAVAFALVCAAFAIAGAGCTENCGN